MKRVILIISLVILTQAAYCQNQLGIKIGYNWFTIHQSDTYYHPSNFKFDRNSVPIAIFFCQRNHLINCYFEIEYLNKSYSVNEYWGGLGAGGYADYKINSSYLNAIIAPQFVFGRKIKAIVFPGLYVGTPVYSEINGTLYEFSLEQYSRQESLTGSAKGCIPGIDFGALAGVGIDIPVSKKFIITIQDVFSISLIPFNSQWGDDTYRFMQNKIEVGLAYQFSDKKNEKTITK
jgi:hypothetical protein